MIDSYMALENPWKSLSKTNYIFNPNPKEQDICSNYTHCDTLLRPIKLLIASKSVHFSFFIWVECKLWNIFAFPSAWEKVLWSYWHLVVHPLHIFTSHSYPNPLPCHLPNSYTHSRGPQYPWGWHSQHPRPSAWIFFTYDHLPFPPFRHLHIPYLGSGITFSNVPGPPRLVDKHLQSGELVPCRLSKAQERELVPSENGHKHANPLQSMASMIDLSTQREKKRKKKNPDFHLKSVGYSVGSSKMQNKMKTIAEAWCEPN